MVDTKDTIASEVDSQEFASKDNANTVNNNSERDSQTNDKAKALDDDTIFDNMIFPS